MKTHRKRRKGFTLIELLVVVSIIAMLAAGGFAGYSLLLPKFRANSSAAKAQTIYKMLFSLAENGDYPDVDGGDANANFRVLFEKGIMGGDGEKQFTIDSDPWCKKKPADGDVTGEAALSPGENSWVYVAGQSSTSESTLPLMANAFAGEQAGVYVKDTNRLGGVFAGQKAVVTYVGGSTEVLDLDSKDFTVRKKKGGTMEPIFSEQYGTPMDKVKNPTALPSSGSN